MFGEGFVRWLYDNRSWLFEGAGVALVAAFGSLLFAIGRRRKRAASIPSPVYHYATVQRFSGEIAFPLHGKTKERTVYYPVPFRTSPKLDVEFALGRMDELDLMEQRPDAFRIRLGGDGSTINSSDVVVSWTAEGVLCDAPSQTESRV